MHRLIYAQLGGTQVVRMQTTDVMSKTLQTGNHQVLRRSRLPVVLRNKTQDLLSIDHSTGHTGGSRTWSELLISLDNISSGVVCDVLAMPASGALNSCPPPPTSNCVSSKQEPSGPQSQHLSTKSKDQTEEIQITCCLYF